ncbi:transcriptional regulator [Dickeya sp. CFBP 2040]|nr:transcriptional regulator [Dickeya sp. CFBP 2040]
MIIIKYLGWERCAFHDYREIALKYGFNAETSPYFLEFAMEHGAALEFFLLKKKGVITGACCVDNGWLCNDVKNPKSQTSEIPIPGYAIKLPFLNGTGCVIPFKSKHLSLDNINVFNASFSILSKRDVAISKSLSEFSKKTISTRNREMKKFLEDGGSFRSLSEFQAGELYSIYCDLYSKRRPEKSAFSQVGKDFFHSFQKDFIGDVALINNEPVAFQLNLSSLSNYGLFVDFINIGYDTSVKNHSLGTLMMWRNLQLIESQALACHAPLTYSFGMMSGEYKKRWCNAYRVGRVITI